MNTVPDQMSLSHVADLSSCDQFHEIIWTRDDFVADDPIAALELRLSMGADADRVQLPRQIAEFVWSWSEREIALGGDGMILDRDASTVHAGGLTLVLRPLDVRYSKTRLEQLANEISTGGAMVSSSVEPLADDGLLDRVVTEMANPTGSHVPAAITMAFVGVTSRILVHATSKRGQVL